MGPKSANFEFKVGIFVIIGLLTLAVIVFKIGDFEFFTPGYNIHIIFNYVGGVDAGAPVKLSGVKVGELKNMEIFYNKELGKTQVDVTVWITSNVDIRENSIAKVKTLGILGEKYLELTPGSVDNRTLKDGDVLFGQDPVSIEDMAEAINRAARDLNETIYSINNVIGNSEVRQSMREGIKDFEKVTKRANAILVKIDEGQGTVGKLIGEDKIYRDLEELVADIKRNPWKLLHRIKEEPQQQEKDEKSKDNVKKKKSKLF